MKALDFITEDDAIVEATSQKSNGMDMTPYVEALDNLYAATVKAVAEKHRAPVAQFAPDESENTRKLKLRFTNAAKFIGKRDGLKTPSGKDGGLAIVTNDNADKSRLLVWIAPATEKIPAGMPVDKSA